MEQRTKSGRILPYASASVLGIGIAFFGWQLTTLHATIAEGRDDIHALRAQLVNERLERSELERRAAESARRAEELSLAVAEARAAAADSGDGFGATLRRIEGRQAVLEAGFVGVRDQLSTTVARLDEQGAQLKSVQNRLEVVAPTGYDRLLGPTVKISSKSDVGSGTVIFSQKTGRRYTSYVLTAHHIVEQNWDPRSPIPLDVINFKDGQKTREERGTVVSVNPTLDLALIEVQSDRPYEQVAKLLTPERIAEVKLYSRVNAIGCPLGYAPTPTSGELTSKAKVLDGQLYWMINAPTIFGNSGGGIYLSETGEMIGVLSRISAYKNLIDVAVPHMGIITSMSDVYAWLGGQGYQFVLDTHFPRPTDPAKPQLAGRETKGQGPAVPAALSATRDE